jgi:hypothetical protein
MKIVLLGLMLIFGAELWARNAPTTEATNTIIITSHCSLKKGNGELLLDWPDKDSLSPRFRINSKESISSVRDLNDFLNSRPISLKENQVIHKVFKSNGWVFAFMTFPCEIKGNPDVVARAYAVKEGTTEVFYWFNW